MPQLIFTAAIDPDRTCELFVEAHSNGFSGIGSAWFNADEIESFASKLELYPIHDNNKPELASGYYSPDGSGRLIQKLLHILVYPTDGVGTLGIRVELSTPLHGGSRPESRHAVELELKNG